MALLATGLFGEAGSVLAELKKTVRERGAYPSYQNRLTEEVGDLLWYFARLCLSLRHLTCANWTSSPNVPANMMTMPTTNPSATRWNSAALPALCSPRCSTVPTMSSHRNSARSGTLSFEWPPRARIDVRQAADKNLDKTQSRWPSERDFTPLFDEWFDETERIPRRLDVEFRQIRRGDKHAVLLRCNGLNIGDRLTDNIDNSDFYRFHDVFHLAHAVYLGWSPVVRVLLNCKRKSDPRVDENPLLSHTLSNKGGLNLPCLVE